MWRITREAEDGCQCWGGMKDDRWKKRCESIGEVEELRKLKMCYRGVIENATARQFEKYKRVRNK